MCFGREKKGSDAQLVGPTTVFGSTLQVANKQVGLHLADFGPVGRWTPLSETRLEQLGAATTNFDPLSKGTNRSLEHV